MMEHMNTCMITKKSENLRYLLWKWNIGQIQNNVLYKRHICSLIYFQIEAIKPTRHINEQNMVSVAGTGNEQKIKSSIIVRSINT